MTVEGEKDDISGVGQTEAAQALCVEHPAGDEAALFAAGVGHYGVFNGSRFRAQIAPRIGDFHARVDARQAERRGEAQVGKERGDRPECLTLRPGFPLQSPNLVSIGALPRDRRSSPTTISRCYAKFANAIRTCREV